jgi:hypothetical protein
MFNLAIYENLKVLIFFSFQFQSRRRRPREEGGRRVRLPDGVDDGGVHRRTKLRPHTDRKSPRLQRIRNRAAPELAIQVKKKKFH